MKDFRPFPERFTNQSKTILGDNLAGVYLHGSAAMGCFIAEKSDLDLLVVVDGELSDKTKLMFIDMVAEMNKEAPEKGIELSIVKRDVCKPFVYPTPFELHFSNKHLEWYLSNPDEYVEKINGTDRDLAAHITVIKHRGKVLYGKEIDDVILV